MIGCQRVFSQPGGLAVACLPKKIKAYVKTQKMNATPRLDLKVPFKEMKLADMTKPLANIRPIDPLPATDLFGGHLYPKRTGKKPRPYNDKLAEDICNRLMQGKFAPNLRGQ